MQRRADVFPMAFIFLLGLTNGNLATLVLMHAPSLLPESLRYRPSLFRCLTNLPEYRNCVPCVEACNTACVCLCASVFARAHALGGGCGRTHACLQECLAIS